MYRNIKLNLVNAGKPDAFYWFLLPEVAETHTVFTLAQARRCIDNYYRYLAELAYG